MIYRDLLDQQALEQYAGAINARARVAGASGTLSAAAVRDRILASAGRCVWCGGSLLGAEFELDHVVSLSQRGANTAGNLVVACPDCNRRKGQKHPARFAAEIYHETGNKTSLIAGLLRHFDIDAAQQMSFLDITQSEGAPASGPDADQGQIKPYRWTD